MINLKSATSKSKVASRHPKNEKSADTASAGNVQKTSKVFQSAASGICPALGTEKGQSLMVE